MEESSQKIKDFLKDLLKNLLTLYSQQLSNNDDVIKYLLTILNDMFNGVLKDLESQSFVFSKVSSFLIIFDSLLMCFPKFLFDDNNFLMFMQFLEIILDNIQKINEERISEDNKSKYYKSNK